MKKKQTFEEAISRLEEITRLLDQEALPLEESLSLFQEGAALVELCNGKLKDAKLKIETLFPVESDTMNGEGNA